MIGKVPGSAANPDLLLKAAYAHCRNIARTQAKNFYYAFLVLPREKRNAICAVYAFMRRADDIADNEQISIEERIAVMDKWLADWHAGQSGKATSDLVFVALRDAQQRFGIPTELLEQLVQGTTMDLVRPQDREFEAARDGAGVTITESRQDVLHTYGTFEDLYQYCYYVASVVGLVCIRIFGYRDSRAEKLAEETGVAFQLTNILRDVREDAERGRVYLPIKDLESCGLSAEEIAGIRSGAELTEDVRNVLRMEAERAEKFYGSASALLPLIAPDSRASLWVLVTIYHKLLREIVKRNYDVFSKRASVPAWQKWAILMRGLSLTAIARLGLTR